MCVCVFLLLLLSCLTRPRYLACASPRGLSLRPPLLRAAVCAVAVECCCFIFISRALPSGMDTARPDTLSHRFSVMEATGWDDSTQELVTPKRPAALILTRLTATEFSRVRAVVQQLRGMIYFFRAPRTAHAQLHQHRPAPALSAEFKNPVCSVACV